MRNFQLSLIAVCLACLAAAACSESTGNTDGGSKVDLTAAKPDLTTPPDLASPPDLSPAIDLSGPPPNCITEMDCRLFNGYCADMPCHCYALNKNQPDPPCNVGMVTCFMVPCMNKKAVCVGGECYVQ